MNCPRCRGNLTSSTLMSLEHDVNEYARKQFLVKISGHDFYFQALEHMFKLPGDPSPRWERVRYEWTCDGCGYEWDVIWPNYREIHGKKGP